MIFNDLASSRAAAPPMEAAVVGLKFGDEYYREPEHRYMRLYFLLEPASAAFQAPGACSYA